MVFVNKKNKKTRPVYRFAAQLKMSGWRAKEYNSYKFRIRLTSAMGFFPKTWVLQVEHSRTDIGSNPCNSQHKVPHWLCTYFTTTGLQSPLHTPPHASFSRCSPRLVHVHCTLYCCTYCCSYFCINLRIFSYVFIFSLNISFRGKYWTLSWLNFINENDFWLHGMPCS